MRPLNTLHKAVNYTMSGAIKRRSPNTRTYYSHYHKPGKDLNAGIAKGNERGQLVLSILGDRRPYKVVVLYKIDKLNGGKFKFDRYDKSLALHYRAKLKEYLASRPEERDVIDDFRPY